MLLWTELIASIGNGRYQADEADEGLTLEMSAFKLFTVANLYR